MQFCFTGSTTLGCQNRDSKSRGERREAERLVSRSRFRRLTVIGARAHRSNCTNHNGLTGNPLDLRTKAPSVQRTIGRYLPVVGRVGEEAAARFRYYGRYCCARSRYAEPEIHDPRESAWGTSETAGATPSRRHFLTGEWSYFVTVRNCLAECCMTYFRWSWISKKAEEK